MGKNKPELRTEQQQNLSERAQKVEEAKTLITAMSGNSEENIRAALKKAHPDLTEQNIKDLLK